MRRVFETEGTRLKGSEQASGYPDIFDVPQKRIQRMKPDTLTFSPIRVFFSFKNPTKRKISEIKEKLQLHTFTFPV